MALLQKEGQKEIGRSFRDVFSSLSAEDANTQAVVLEIPESVGSSLDEFHFSVKAFGYPIALGEAEHAGYLLFP